ncbi:MAG: hypothetical protein J5692_00175 [Bacteroidales bacterium]|nr:hypothetical protein [Bacteroidales bacterium]
MWDNTNKLMYPPLNENDISQAVGGAAGHDSGSIDDLCYYGNINVWAKYKPVRSSEPGMVDRNTLEMLGFGSSLPSASTIAGLINLYDGGFNGWTYLRTGDAASRRGRYYDFLKVVNGNLDTVNPGYHGTAPNPFGSSFSASPSTVDHNAGVLRVEQRRFPPVGDYPDYDLAIKDFNDLLNNSLKMQYYGCVIKGAPGGQASSIGARLFGNNSITIGTTRGKEELYYDLTLNPSAFATVGDYLVYPCLSNGPLGFNVSLASGQKLYPIPGVSPATITIIDDYIVIVCTAKAYNNVGTGYYGQWSYTVYNYYSTAITLTDGKAKFRLSGKGFNDPLTYGEAEVTLGNNGTIPVPANGTYEYPGSGLTTDQQLTDRDLSQLIVGFKYNNQLKTGYREFIVPAAPTI